MFRRRGVFSLISFLLIIAVIALGGFSLYRTGYGQGLIAAQAAEGEVAPPAVVAPYRGYGYGFFPFFGIGLFFKFIFWIFLFGLIARFLFFPFFWWGGGRFRGRRWHKGYWGHEEGDENGEANPENPEGSPAL